MSSCRLLATCSNPVQPCMAPFRSANACAKTWFVRPVLKRVADNAATKYASLFAASLSKAFRADRASTSSQKTAAKRHFQNSTQNPTLVWAEHLDKLGTGVVKARWAALPMSPTDEALLSAAEGLKAHAKHAQSESLFLASALTCPRRGSIRSAQTVFASRANKMRRDALPSIPLPEATP